MLHKKGDPTDPRNYRGIAILSSILKVFTQIINTRLLTWAYSIDIIPEAQSGFRKDRSCLDNIFVLSSTVQRHLRRGAKNLLALFVDFARAFDSVPHGVLFAKLHGMGCSPKIIRLLQSLYGQAVLNVRVGNSLSGDIPVTEGVLQGEVLSPLLFSLFLANLELHLRQDGIEGPSLNPTEDLLLLMYADDIVILARSPVILRRILASLDRYCALNGLNVNTAKTKVMELKQGGRKTNKAYFYHNDPIEVVRSYEYLGVMVSDSTLGLQAAVHSHRCYH